MCKNTHTSVEARALAGRWLRNPQGTPGRDFDSGVLLDPVRRRVAHCSPRRGGGGGLGFPLMEAFRAPGLHARRDPGRSNAPLAKGRPVHVAEPLVRLWMTGFFSSFYVRITCIYEENRTLNTGMCLSPFFGFLFALFFFLFIFHLGWNVCE